jgi:ABC-type glycerol-3-phosphate transport system substrate-binding protein
LLFEEFLHIQQERRMAKMSLSRRKFLALSSLVGVSALAACAAPAPGTQPAAGGTVQRISVSHWVYSDLPLDRDTLTSVPADRTENVVKYFDWSVEQFQEEEPNVDVQLEYLPHDQSWFAKLDASLIAGTPPDVVQGPVSEAAKYIPLGALSYRLKEGDQGGLEFYAAVPSEILPWFYGK